MKRLQLRLLLAGMVLVSGLVSNPGIVLAAGKYAIVLQAGRESHEGMARALHAFLYAKELKERGHEVVVIFDGTGTAWAEELSNPESASKLKPMYDQFKKQGILEIVCDYCAGAFKVKESLVERKTQLVGEYAGHPSIAKWIDEGFELIIL